MPELPEVETTLRGIEPHILNKTIVQTIVHQPKLRWPVPHDLAETLVNATVLSCNRRAKYLLIRFAHGLMMIHLGMSGSLRIFTAEDERIDQPKKHDHLEFLFDDGTLMRYHDPRRFGAVLWFAGAAEHHPLLAALGPEPLSDDFNAAYLHQKLLKQKRAVKVALMDNAVVVGVGNIYANESLFMASILPLRPANRLSLEDCTRLVSCIQIVLQRAITAGGSSLRDFVNSDGNSGYFQQQYAVYGRTQQICHQCGGLIDKVVISQRSTFYCPLCQS